MDFIISFVVAAVLAGTPLLFGTLGEIMHERVGHLNLGVEGMMSIGALAGFMVGYQTDSFVLAIIASFIAGALCALIYALLTITLMANQTVSGLTLTIFGIGLTNFLGYHYLSLSEEGTLKLPKGITETMRSLEIPGLSDLPVIGPMLFSYNPFVYIGIVIAVILAVYYNKTK
ncbi:MAG: ABC transporter permease, partial [Clostridia bacterium]|nr:ABC transporter permease [Clostridia bacterium]